VKVIGLDISLRATGIAVITDVPFMARTDVYRTAPDDGTLAGRRNRIADIARAVLPMCAGADLVAVEGPSYHSVGGKSHDRSGLWWGIVGALAVPVVEIPPTVRMLWACGKGKADKGDVMNSIRVIWPGVAVADHNAADALVLATMASQRVGLLRYALPHHAQAGRSVHWPAGQWSPH